MTGNTGIRNGSAGPERRARRGSCRPTGSGAHAARSIRSAARRGRRAPRGRAPASSHLGNTHENPSDCRANYNRPLTPDPTVGTINPRTMMPAFRTAKPIGKPCHDAHSPSPADRCRNAGSRHDIRFAQTLTIGVRGGPDSIDPHFTATGTHAETLKHVFDTLVWSGDELEIDRASLRVEGVDPTTWEFKLRNGVKFHDGSDFTSEDGSSRSPGCRRRWARTRPRSTSGA